MSATAGALDNLEEDVELPKKSQDEVSTSAGSSNGDGETTSVEEALQIYSQYFGKQSHRWDPVCFHGSAFPWQATDVEPKENLLPGDAIIRAAFEKDIHDPKSDKAEVSARPRKHYRFKDVPSNSDLKDVDSDGEIHDICKICQLPLGEIVYSETGTCRQDSLHGECFAQEESTKIQKDEARRREHDDREHTDGHDAYNIGWKVEYIPRNSVAASQLAMREIPQGMVCLVLEEETNSILIAATWEPAAAINLEYLSIALQVRRETGHEPIFSLDPMDPFEDPCVRRSMQQKVFGPEWLAGTSVGEVLFQADYHLKELSMGRSTQPVIGMKSAFDISCTNDEKAEWVTREWFVVRKAEMRISDNNALIPFVNMGVEAKEQMLLGDSLEDMRVTRASHPMVIYAETFTKNFDLIAERKSVVFHLRELAKASVAAKYLLEAQIQLDGAWFCLATVRETPCSLEVPQIWSKVTRGRLQMDGKCIHQTASLSEDGVGSTGTMQVHAVYGGVNFGLNKFTIASRVQRVPTRVPTLLRKESLPDSAVTRMHPLAVSVGPLRKVPKPVSKFEFAAKAGFGATRGLTTPAQKLSRNAGLVPRECQLFFKESSLGKPMGSLMSTARMVPFAAPGMSATPSRIPTYAAPTASVSAMYSPEFTAGAFTANLTASRLSAKLAPPSLVKGAIPTLSGLPVGAQMQLQGVDLRLDTFSLSEAKRVSLEAHGGSWGADVQSLDNCVAIGDSFWASLEEDDTKSLFQDEDRDLLNTIFNPALSDRRSEGDLFCPPDATHSYVARLRALVEEEENVRRQRREHFLSDSFTPAAPGCLFPPWWTPLIDVCAFDYTVRDVRNQMNLVPRPEYKDCAAELVDTVLKASTPIFDRATEEGTNFKIYHVGSLEIRTIQETNRPEEVGAVFSLCQPADCPNDGVGQSEPVHAQEEILKATEYVERVIGVEGKLGVRRRYYVVLETVSGAKISIERIADGSVRWAENPKQLEVRNSSARIVRFSECSGGVTVQDIKAYQAIVARGACTGRRASPSTCKRYARSAYDRVVGPSPECGIAFVTRKDCFVAFCQTLSAGPSL